MEADRVSIGEDTFERILKGVGWTDTQDALRHIDETGCLIRQSKGRYKTRTTRDMVPYYSYYFDMSKVKEQFDGEFELRFSSLVQRHEWDERTSFNIEYLDDSEALINGYNCKLNGQGRAFEGKLFLL